MKTHTFKYDIGDKVYRIRNAPVENWVTCDACGGAGKIPLLNGKTTDCPECHYDRDGQKVSWTKPFWHIAHDHLILTIGQQRVQKTKKATEETYMCSETGVGSGSIYYAADLFPDIESANAECEKRNANKSE